MVTRRDFLKYTGLTGVGFVLTRHGLVATPQPATVAFSDPLLQPMFMALAPNAMDPAFMYKPDKKGRYKVRAGAWMQQTGLVDPVLQAPLSTPIWGYGDINDRMVTWPGKTFEIQSSQAGGAAQTEVIWGNALDGLANHLLPVDTNLHWCYSLPGYAQHTIASAGVPIITHLHGGHTDFQYDGNPEFFYGPAVMGQQVVGPQWANVPGGFTTKFIYDNNVPAGTLWYHDHALGITRLNVYAGMAGFYIVRDGADTGLPGNSLGLPAFPYELAYAIQDRMFTATGELFYPAFPGDPFYADFIDGEGAILPATLFPGGGPTALAEFFGDHMVVNGKIWPKANVEPRHYRIRLLNGTDSRFMALEFWAVPPGATDFSDPGVYGPIDFAVIGSDQGLASSPTPVSRLVSEPGSRYDVIFNFGPHDGRRIILRNRALDEPFGGEIPDADDVRPFERTNRIMAFDVVVPLSSIADVTPSFSGSGYGPPNHTSYNRKRKVALFEGKDEFGRLQPLLGTAEPATDHAGTPINWPATPKYQVAGLTGQMEGSIPWHSPTTENPQLGDVEEWEIWNVTADAHPIHLHLVNFKVVDRRMINWDSNADDEGILAGGAPAGDGIYLVPQKTVQHNSDPALFPETYGNGFRIVFPATPANAYGASVDPGPAYVENAPKDMVTALPGQITRIRAKFDKAGRYVWHCHILSHEDHEMMRVLHVGPGA